MQGKNNVYWSKNILSILNRVVYLKNIIINKCNDIKLEDILDILIGFHFATAIIRVSLLLFPLYHPIIGDIYMIVSALLIVLLGMKFNKANPNNKIIGVVPMYLIAIFIWTLVLITDIMKV